MWGFKNIACIRRHNALSCTQTRSCKSCLGRSPWFCLLKFQTDNQILRSLQAALSVNVQENNFQAYLCELLIQTWGTVPGGESDTFTMGDSAGRAAITDPRAAVRLQHSPTTPPPLHCRLYPPPPIFWLSIYLEVLKHNIQVAALIFCPTFTLTPPLDERDGFLRAIEGS